MSTNKANDQNENARQATTQQNASGMEQHSISSSRAHNDTSNINQNTETAFKATFEQMMAYHREETEDSAAKAEKMALELINNADLPLLLRVRSHMVLACGNGEYLWHAHEAVRIAKKGIELFGEGAASNALLSDAGDVLRRAERDHEEMMEQRRELETHGYQVVDGDLEEGEEVEVARYGDGKTK